MLRFADWSRHSHHAPWRRRCQADSFSQLRRIAIRFLVQSHDRSAVAVVAYPAVPPVRFADFAAQVSRIAAQGPLSVAVDPLAAAGKALIDHVAVIDAHFCLVLSVKSSVIFRLRRITFSVSSPNNS